MKRKLILKVDHLIIIVIALVLICLLFIYNDVNINESNIQIIFKNELIIEENIETENRYLIESNDEFNKISIYKNGILINEINIFTDRYISYEILISNNKVKVLKANCINKDCMNMYIDYYHLFPIICVDGLIIKVVDKENGVDIVS